MIASQIALVYGTYIVATASPGPSNMAIMGTAMRDGRLPALALTAGVITGSLFWAILAATGMSAVLAAYAQALFVIKIFGGVYLLYLAFRAGRSAMKPVSDFVSVDTGRATPRYRALYRQGLLMHIGNPKAIMAWIAIMSLGCREDAPAGMFLNDHWRLRHSRCYRVRQLCTSLFHRLDDCALYQIAALDRIRAFRGICRRRAETASLAELTGRPSALPINPN